ncbi:MAG: M3 family oligoendopeptidase [Fimbriimonadaceae bacterium]|nr:M3 family oligoendopeptidase [Fimbriimonadaceae bacterium]
MSTALPVAAEGVRWNLTSLFGGTEDPKLELTWKECNARAEAFAQNYRGKVEPGTLSAHELLAAFQEYEALSSEASKPVHYANLRFAADTSDASLGAFLQAQMERASRLRVKLIFFGLELMSAPEAWASDMLADPVLENYRHFLGEVRKAAPHRLTEPEETLLELTANTGCRAWVRLHDELTSNHVYRYWAPGASEAAEMAQEEILDKLRDPDREVRTAAANAFSQGLEELQRPAVFLYNTLLADKALDDELRKYSQPEDSRHLENELDVATVDTVMQLCKERSDLVERYYLAKQGLLGLPELTHVDRYAPLADSKRKVGWDEAKQIVLDSFHAFSPKMAAVAQEFFSNDWIDAEPRPGKSGGAFCNYNTPDTHPVLFQTYLGSSDDVMTLAHEMGHGIHGALSRSQSPLNFNGTLPLAELASIFGEMLVFERLVGEADDEERLALYASKIEGIFASVHRQAAMFRFEQRCHRARRETGELAAEELGDIWQEEIQSMFGQGLKLGEQHRVWWEYVGHFVFAPFYVYAYSFGELLTLGVYDLARQEGPSFADKYVGILELGGKETPQELMARLGVDLRSREFWQGGFRAIEAMVAEFERLASVVRPS